MCHDLFQLNVAHATCTVFGRFGGSGGILVCVLMNWINFTVATHWIEIIMYHLKIILSTMQTSAVFVSLA